MSALAKAWNFLQTSVEGRANRTEFWAFVLIANGINYCLGTDYFHDRHRDVLADQDAPNLLDYSIAIAILLLKALMVAAFVVVCIRRLHDRSRPGWLLLFGFIPILGQLWIIVELGFFPPVNQSNGYTPEVDMQSHRAGSDVSNDRLL